MNIILFEFKRLIKPCLIWSCVCILLTILSMSIFPSMATSDMQELVQGKLGALPEGFLKAFNIEKNMDFSNLYSYLAYSLHYIAIASGIYGSILGVSALSKEESEETISFLYVKPLTRREILNTKILSHFMIYIAYILANVIITFLICLLVKTKEDTIAELLNKTILLFGGFFFIGIVFFSVGMLISILQKKKRDVIPISLGIFFISYFLGVISKLREEVTWLKYFSPLEYFSTNEIVVSGLDEKFILISWIIIVVSLLISYFLYRRKDFHL